MSDLEVYVYTGLINIILTPICYRIFQTLWEENKGLPLWIYLIVGILGPIGTVLCIGSLCVNIIFAGFCLLEWISDKPLVHKMLRVLQFLDKPVFKRDKK